MLTPAMIHAARYEGNKPIANRKRHTSQIKTALVNLRNDCDADRGELKGLLSADEIETLTAAIHLVDKIAATLERDAAEAKRIKDAWDKRCASLAQALREVTSDSAADVVALLSIDRQDYTLRDLAADCQRWGGARRTLCDKRRDAIASLARSAASSDVLPVAWAATIKGEMSVQADKYTALIAEINTIAVAQRLEQANRSGVAA